MWRRRGGGGCGRLLLHQSNTWSSNGLILGGGGEGCPHPNLLGKLQLFLYCCVGCWGRGEVQVTYLCFQSTVVTANLSRISDNISSRQRQRANIRKIGDNATSDIYSASRHCRVVAKIVTSAQLCKYVRKNLTGNKG